MLSLYCHVLRTFVSNSTACSSAWHYQNPVKGLFWLPPPFPTSLLKTTVGFTMLALLCFFVFVFA